MKYITGHNTIFQNGMDNKNSQLQQLVQDVDCWSMAFLIKILQKKYELIQHLQRMNKEIQMNKDQLTEEFLNHYGWTGVQINLFDEAQKHALTKFRLRGLGAYQITQVNDHLDKILSVPLAYMERELEQNQEPNNEETLQELKSIINKMQDEKIFRDLQLLLNQSLNKESMSEEEDDQEEENEEIQEEQQKVQVKEEKKELNEEQQKQFLPLITSLLGVLLTMNHSGDINLTSNQYIQNLGKEIYSTHQNQFCEINEAIIRILGNNK